MEFRTGDRVIVFVNFYRSLVGDVEDTALLVVRVGGQWYSVSQCLMLWKRKPVQLSLVK
jgi:hypothetical protein